MKLIDALKAKKFRLTENEKVALQAVRNQGSFYEESLSTEWDGQAFLGYYLTKEDVGNKFNPAGVISSLVKKGILTAGDALGDGTIGYWINYELDFQKDGWSIVFD